MMRPLREWFAPFDADDIGDIVVVVVCVIGLIVALVVSR